MTSVVDHSAQTGYSDPGRLAELFDAVPPTIEGVSAMARNLVVHYRASGRELPEHSRDDIALRWVEAILDVDRARHDLPLTAERPIEQRVQGCCRDHSLLAVSALRHHGVAARSRVGFTSYILPTWHHDHVIVEAWIGGRWRRFDPEFESPVPALPDPTDIEPWPADRFMTAAQVWLEHRQGRLDVSRFGVDEGLGLDGEWFVHCYVIGEVAHRFGDELLLWDDWGMMYFGDAEPADGPSLPERHELTDRVARLLVEADGEDLDAERELLALYRIDDRLHPGRLIRSISPNGGVDRIDLEARTRQRLT
ncbi:MAG: transglutaminase domain-containing protein [Acidimicrobiales bacterium]